MHPVLDLRQPGWFWHPCGPLERFSQRAIVDLDEVHQCRLEFRHAGKNAAIEGATFKLGKPTLDSVQPGRARWGEVEVDIRPGLQPVSDLLRCVCAVVVKDDVQVLSLRMAPIDLAQERAAFFGPGSRRYLAHDGTGQDIECRIQTRCPVAFVVVGPAADFSWIER